jgi:ubiquinone/menaquinone biosynthesis C-methylase UbiE
MNNIDSHPILGQLNETQRRLTNVAEIQNALTERRRVMERDGKYTTIVAGVIGISGLFFMNPLPFYLVLGLLVIGLPLVWRHLVKEAREFVMTDDEIEEKLKIEDRR